MGKTREIVGEVEEEELEGEAVVGPSGEATVHSSGNTHPIPLILIVINLCVHIFFFFQHILTAYFTVELSPFSWQMSPAMGKHPDPKPRRRRTLIFFIVGCKWGVSCSSRGGGIGAFVGGGFTLMSLCFFLFIRHSTPLYIPTSVFSSIFQGLDLLKKSGSLQEGAYRLETEAQYLEMEGLGKMEVAVAG